MDTKEVRGRTFGHWLQRKMAAREWNGADLARAIERAGGKATSGDVSRWRRGVRTPYPEKLERIAEALDVSHEEAMEAAGYTARVPLDQIERFNRITHPYARRLDWTNPQNQLSIVTELENLIKFQEMRAGKRTIETFNDPLEIDDTEDAV